MAARATTKKNSAKRGSARRANAIFGDDAVLNARRVRPTRKRRVKLKQTGARGTMLGVRDGWIKIKLDDADRPHFARRSQLQRSNPTAFFCADCERELKKGSTAMRRADGLTVCKPCFDEARRRAEAKRQRALFGESGSLFEHMTNPAHREPSSLYPVRVEGYNIPTHYRAKPKPGRRAKAATVARAKRRKPIEQLMLSEFVRRQGGIRPDRDGENSGELRRLGLKEGRTTGLVNRNSSYSADRMMESALGAGFRDYDGNPWASPQAFIESVHDDFMGYYKIRHPGYEYSEAEMYGVQANPGVPTWIIAGAQLIGAANGAIDLNDKVREKLKDRKRRNPATKENGWLLDRTKGAVARRRASRAYRRELRRGSALDRARSKRKEYERQAMENPATTPAPKAVRTTHRMFQGRDPERQNRSRVSVHVNNSFNPQHTSALGRLSMIQVNGVTYEGTKEVTVKGKKFRVFPNSWLIALPGRRLAISGLKFKRPAELENPGGLVFKGLLERVGYVTHKDHLHGGGSFDFRHEQGEEGGTLPKFFIDYEGRPVIKGGGYVVRREGIRN